MYNATPWNVSGATIVQLAAELVGVVVAVVLALRINYLEGLTSVGNLGSAAVFAILTVTLSGAFGLYRRDRKLGLRAYVGRLFVVLLLTTPVSYLAAAMLPGGVEFQHALDEVVVFVFAGLVALRHLIIFPVTRVLLPHRVLVLGTGPEARMVEAALAASEVPGLRLVGFYMLEKVQESVVSPTSIVTAQGSLDQTAKRLGIHEIIVAVREQRGGVLPIRALLECRLSGIQVTDLARFFERVHGQVLLDAVKASWLIYGNGFRQGWLRTTVKRCFDLVVSALILLATLPVMLIAALLIALESGAPIIYRQERVGLHGRTFQLFKFRSMSKDAERDGKAAWAVADDPRITALGRWLRRTRIDELPQLLNVLRGEMSFVGPRPERPQFVEMLTEQVPFYAVRLSVKPGITGWAQVRYSYGASVEQSMRKLEYDLYYVKNHTLFLDVLILLETFRVVLTGEGAR
ncbi:MAG TPA: TIGR03013 family XrtA/PEP-CTERM system glycosyltransferase [Casimicrobiaceae bacterium]|nr:TIGR03013 family XrtA/PEP-CTERM system glycosyltransferase [Casimicrobiaceae bacterium]